MRSILTCLLLALPPWHALTADERPYINDKKAPENRKDLDAIQSALAKALPNARAATVCIELGEGSGSGVIVSADGLILTAAHVSSGVNKKATVVLEDGTKLKAETLGLVAGTDAAMMRITEKGTWPFVEPDRSDSIASRRLGLLARPLGRFRQGPRLGGPDRPPGAHGELDLPVGLHPDRRGFGRPPV
jgi:serine protease Do